MIRDPSGDFDHPRVPEGNRLRPHVLYRLSAGEWAARGRARPARRPRQRMSLFSADRVKGAVLRLDAPTTW